MTHEALRTAHRAAVAAEREALEARRALDQGLAAGPAAWDEAGRRAREHAEWVQQLTAAALAALEET